jgi:hypothetical protein
LAILKKFYELTKYAKGTKLSSKRGVLSDYMTIMNELIKHVRSIRDDIRVRTANPCLVTPALDHLKTCSINCWTKLDEYFAKLNDTPAHYASVVITPYSKWKYFEHNWADVHKWQDTTNPGSWLPSGKKALKEIWSDYKNLLILEADTLVAGSKRPRSPTDFEKSTNIALLYGQDTGDELKTWLSRPPFELDEGDTLP